MRIETSSYKHQLNLNVEGETLFVAPYQLFVNGRAVFADEVIVEGTRARARFGDSVIEDAFEFEPGQIALRRTWRLQGQYRARLDCSLIRRARAVSVVCPGAAYRDVPADDAFTLNAPESQCTIPSMIFMEDDGLCWAMFTEAAARRADLSAARGHVSGDFSEIGIAVPGAADGEAVDGVFEYERTFYILYEDPEAQTFRGILERAWSIAGGGVVAETQAADWSDPVRARIETLLGRYFIERPDATGFVAELSPSGFPVSAALIGGGSGGNVAAARALYRVAAMGGPDALRRRALAVADFFQEGFEAHGSACDTYLPAARRWQAPASGPRHARAVAAMCREYLLLYETARRARDHNPRWLRSCRRWLAAQAKAALAGVPDTNSEPFTAAYLVSALCVASRLSGGGAGDTAAAAQLASQFAQRRRVADWRLPPGPPRAGDATAAMSALLDLHGATGDAAYLDAAEAAGTLLISYTFHPASAANAGCITLEPGGGALEPAAAHTALELLRLHAATERDFLRHVAVSQLAAAAARARNAAAPWPGADPHRIPLSGRASGLLAATPIAFISAAVDIHDQFPGIMKIEFSKEDAFKSETSSLDRALLQLGSYLNFKK